MPALRSVAWSADSWSKASAAWLVFTGPFSIFAKLGHFKARASKFPLNPPNPLNPLHYTEESRTQSIPL